MYTTNAVPLFLNGNKGNAIGAVRTDNAIRTATSAVYCIWIGQAGGEGRPFGLTEALPEIFTFGCTK